jgi:hypothetical protein
VRSIRSLVILGAVLLVLAAGCGGGNDDTSGNGDRELDRCSLVTPEEAGDWIGAPVTAAPAEGIDGNPDPVTCDYVGGRAHVLVQVYDDKIYFAEPGSAFESVRTWMGWERMPSWTTTVWSSSRMTGQCP